MSGSRGERSHIVANFLIVDDDQLFARSAARQYRGFGHAREVGSIAEAASALKQERWTGVVLDVSLPDGSGLDFLADVRSNAHRDTRMSSVLVCSGLPEERALRSQSSSLAAQFAPKRSGPSRHWRFARRAIASDYVRDEAAGLIADVAHRYEMPTMQTRVLALQVSAIPRDEWPGILNIQPNTLKTHIKRTCNRANASSLQELAAPIVRAVMATSRPRGSRDS